MKTDYKRAKAPTVLPGVRSDAGLLFQGWSRDGRWVGGCLFNERGEIIFGDPHIPKIELQLIAAQMTQPWRYEALRDAQTPTRYVIPCLSEL